MNGSIRERIIVKGADQRGKIRGNLKVYDVYYRYSDTATGRLKQTSKKGFRTKREAEEFLLDVNMKIATSSFVTPKNLALREYLLEWLKNYAEIHLKPTSLEGYTRIINHHIIPALGNIDVKQLTASQIDALYAMLLTKGRVKDGKGLSAKTVMYTHRVFNEALEHAVKRQVIYHNPMKGVTNIPKIRKYKGSVYDNSEIKALIVLAQNTIWEVPIILAAVCGMRRGEILGLHIDDVDFKNYTINIRQQLINIGENCIFSDPKSEESKRIISAPPEVFEILHRQIAQHARNKILLQSEYEDQRLVVCHPDGKWINPKRFTKNFAYFIDKHNLKKIRFHDLRHSCATLMLNSGVPMKVASNILGHSTTTITADLYMHVIEGAKKDAAMQIGKEIFSSKGDPSIG